QDRRRELTGTTMTPDIFTSLALAAPELIVAIGAMVLLMVGVFSGDRSYGMVNGLAIVVLVAAGAWIVLCSQDGTAFDGAFVSDPFSRFTKVLAHIGSAEALLMTAGFARA